MALAADSKQLYIPLSTIYGKKSNDGNYLFSPLDIKNLNDNLYAISKKIQGNLTVADLTSVAVDYLKASTISTENLYAVYGDIADLTVDRLLTANKVQRYLDGDTADINYILIQDQYIKFITGSTEGATTQHIDRDGNPLYWYNAEHTGMSTTATDYPVTVYSYTELIKAQYAFDNTTGTYVPTIILGAGSGTANYGKAFIYKDTNGLYIDYYKSTDGTKYTIKITDDGIDFGGFPAVTADALHQLWVQSSEPTGAKVNDVWADTDDPSRYDRLEITATGTHTISATTAEFLEITGSTAIALTIDATAATAGTVLMVKNSSSEIATLTATINGSTTNVLYPGEMIWLLWNGTDWRG